MADCPTEEFWNLIEGKLGNCIPKYLQNLLALRGYDNALSIKAFTLEDFQELETYVHGDEIKDRVPTDADPADYYGAFGSSPEKFYVLPGHKKLLMEIIELIKLNLVTKGVDYFNITTKRKVKDEAKTLNKTTTSFTSSSSETVTTEVDLDLDCVPTLDKSVRSEEDNIEQDVEGEESQSFAESQVQDEVLNNQSTQQDLFQRVMSWIKTDSRNLYEEFSHEVKLDMVEVTVDREDEHKVLLGLRCPICKHISAFPLVSGNGKKADYYSSSNFTRHLREVHTEKKIETKTARKTQKRRIIRSLRTKIVPAAKKLKMENSEDDGDGDEDYDFEELDDVNRPVPKSIKIDMSTNIADNYYTNTNDLLLQDNNTLQKALRQNSKSFNTDVNQDFNEQPTSELHCFTDVRQQPPTSHPNVISISEMRSKIDTTPVCHASFVSNLDEKYEERRNQRILKNGGKINDFLRLKESQMKAIERAMYGNNAEGDEIITKFRLTIKQCDFLTLQWKPVEEVTSKYLNDMVIDFYMKLLEERAKLRNSDDYPTVYAMSSHFTKSYTTHGYDHVKSYTKDINIFNYDIVLVPVNVNDNHWCMAIIKMKLNTIKYYDSLMKHEDKGCDDVLSKLMEYLRSEGKSKGQIDFSGWRTISVTKYPQQKNSYDCGVFSCMAAEFVCRNRPIVFEQSHMVLFRKRMAFEIMKGKMLL